MRITFQQGPIRETEKSYRENIGKKGQAGMAESIPGAYFDASTGFPDLPGRKEKGKSLIEVQQEAANTDVGVTQDYMTLMSNTLSEEDYKKLQEDGFDFGEMDPGEAVTIVDKIKAELVRSGKKIAGYTDDIDPETLAESLGSVTLANSLVKSFAEMDIPMTEENIAMVRDAIHMAQELKTPGDGTLRYLIDNEMDGEIWNLYLAQNSGADAGKNRGSAYYSEDVEGYYSKNASFHEGELPAERLEAVLRLNGMEPTEENLDNAGWLLRNDLPVTAENLDRIDALKKIELPVSEEVLCAMTAGKLAEGINPIHAEFGREPEDSYRKAVLTEQYYFSEEAEDKAAGNLTARRQLEEIRLRMTAQVNLQLIKSGFSIDTEPMERLVEALKQAERELAEKYFPGEEQAVEKYRIWNRAEQMVSEYPQLPAQVLGRFIPAGDVQIGTDSNAEIAADSLLPPDFESLHTQGTLWKADYEKAGESYEALMTEPRRDLGDSIKKAFANVDDILLELGLDTGEENRRAVRILGYNRMEINPENIDRIREADQLVQSVVKKMTPASILKMIRDGVNPLERDFRQLQEYFDQNPREYAEETEKYSKFLYRLEKNQEITPEERESFIGIYRLLHLLEKSDGAVIGALVDTRAQMQFSNLLSVARSNKLKSYDVKVTDQLGTVAETIRRGESISEQVAKGFVAELREIVTEMSDSKAVDEEYLREQLAELRTAVTRADQGCVELLQRGEMTSSAENLMAAQALLSEIDDLFQTDRNDAEDRKDPGDGQWEQKDFLQLLEDAQGFEEQYRKEIDLQQQIVSDRTFTDAEKTLDVKGLKARYKQLSVLRKLSANREFFIPMYVGERLSRVHLTFEQGKDRKGIVDISVNLGEDGELDARFVMTKGKIRGEIYADLQNPVMNPEEIADKFSKEVTRFREVDSIHVLRGGKGGVSHPMFDNMGEESIPNSEFYQIAKVFLEAVQQA